VLRGLCHCQSASLAEALLLLLSLPSVCMQPILYPRHDMQVLQLSCKGSPSGGYAVTAATSCSLANNN
jgi:hypothetical protein